jgi:lysophospholipase L1-like esterase
MNFFYQTAAVALLTTTLGAQNAAPADRTSGNSTVPIAAAPITGMMADAPFQFPESGAMPAKYTQDMPTETYDAEKDYYLFTSPGRSLAQIATLQSEMPSGQFTPPANDWKHLSRTHKLLTGGGNLQILALGDSIINDTMRSGWIAKLQESYPKAKIKCTVYVRGGGGCQHYKDGGRVAKYIVPAKPDLVYIGGISQKNISSIREVIRQIRLELPNVEFLITPGAFGTFDPRDAESLALSSHSGTGVYGEALEMLAKEQNCAYFNLTSPWREYIISSKQHPALFYRDIVHANEHGEQVLAKIMMAFWNSGKK